MRGERKEREDGSRPRKSEQRTREIFLLGYEAARVASPYGRRPSSCLLDAATDDDDDDDAPPALSPRYSSR